MRRLAILPLVAMLAAAAASPAAAVDLPVTVTVLGTRSLTTVTLPNLVNGVASVLSTTVTETVATGVNGWSVTARLCSPNTTTASQADCGVGSALVKSGGGTIPGTAVTISGRAVTQTAGGGTSAATDGSQDLTAARTIFANSGQSTGSSYTGVYAGTSNITLAVPNGTAAGVYSGFVVVDLVQ